MRRVVLITAAAALLVGSFASLAGAKTEEASPRGSTLFGSKGPDQLFGREGPDTLLGLAGNDYLDGSGEATA